MATNDPARPAEPTCKQCGCLVGGGEYCYEHAPYMVYPQADGSFLSDRGGRKHIWLDDLATRAAPPEGITALLERWREQARWWRDHWGDREQEMNWPDGYYRPSEQYDKFADELAAALRPVGAEPHDIGHTN